MARAERAIALGRSGLAGNHVQAVIVPEIDKLREANANLTNNLKAVICEGERLLKEVKDLKMQVASMTETIANGMTENRELLAQVNAADETIDTLVGAILAAREKYDTGTEVICDDVQSIINAVASKSMEKIVDDNRREAIAEEMEELSADGTDISVRNG